MKRIPFYLTAVILILNLLSIFVHQEVYASDKGPASPKKLGLGIQSAPFPIFGPAIIYNYNSSIGIQAFARVGFDVDFFSLRALYRFMNRSNFNAYASGLIGYFEDSDVARALFAEEESDEAAGFGFGCGLEYFFSKFPCIGWNIEIDYARIGFEDVWFKYDYKSCSLVMAGLGFHYYF